MKLREMRFTAILTVLVAFFAATPSLMAQRGEKSFGIRAGYNTRNESASGGLYFQYRFSHWLRLAPDVEYVFRHSGEDALSLSCNVHVPLSLSASERVAVYPLAGLNYTSWNYHQPGSNPMLRKVAGDDDDVVSRVNRLGLNVGAGLEFYVKPTLKLSVEGKYTVASHYNFGAVSVSIGYVF